MVRDHIFCLFLCSDLVAEGSMSLSADLKDFSNYCIPYCHIMMGKDFLWTECCYGSTHVRGYLICCTYIVFRSRKYALYSFIKCYLTGWIVYYVEVFHSIWRKGKISIWRV